MYNNNVINKVETSLNKSMREFLMLLYYACQDKKDVSKKIKDYDLDDIYDICFSTGLTALVDYILEKNNIIDSKFIDTRDIIIAFSIMFNYEIEQLCDYLEENKVKNILVKGMAIRNTYPNEYLREMGDCDILIEKANREIVKNYLLSQDYSDGSDIDNYHDAYILNNMVIEVHYLLIEGGLNNKWKAFNQQAMDNSIALDGKQYCHQLNINDHYIYLIQHGYKHEILKGIGIRFLLDIWFYRKYYKDDLDYEYIDKTLSEMEILDYERHVYELAQLLFEKGIDNIDLDEDLEKEIVLYILSGANNGALNDGQIIQNVDEVKGKGWLDIYLYSLKQLDDRPKWYAFHSPFAYKHKWYRPIYLFGLSVKKVLNNPIKILDLYGKD